MHGTVNIRKSSLASCVLKHVLLVFGRQRGGYRRERDVHLCIQARGVLIYKTFASLLRTERNYACYSCDLLFYFVRNPIYCI